MSELVNDPKNPVAYWQARWDKSLTQWHINRLHPSIESHYDRWMGPLLKKGTPPRTFLPLCGKSVDLHLLARRGHNVVGLEAVQLALDEYQKENGLTLEPASVVNFVSSSGASNDANVPITTIPAALNDIAKVFAVKSADASDPVNGHLFVVQGDYFRLAQALQLPQPATDGQSSNTNAPTASNESIDAVIRALGGPFEAVFDRGSFIAIHPELRADYVQILTSLLAPGARILLSFLDFDPALNRGAPYALSLAEIEKYYPDSQFEREVLFHTEDQSSRLLVKNGGHLSWAKDGLVLITKR